MAKRKIRDASCLFVSRLFAFAVQPARPSGLICVAQKRKRAAFDLVARGYCAPCVSVSFGHTHTHTPMRTHGMKRVLAGCSPLVAIISTSRPAFLVAIDNFTNPPAPFSPLPRSMPFLFVGIYYVRPGVVDQSISGTASVYSDNASPARRRCSLRIPSLA